jgi:hypothetical protein
MCEEVPFTGFSGFTWEMIRKDLLYLPIKCNPLATEIIPGLKGQKTNSQGIFCRFVSTA